MMRWWLGLRRLGARMAALVCGYWLAANAHALTLSEALALASGDTATRLQTLEALVVRDDARAGALIRALAQEAVWVRDDAQVLIEQDGQVRDAVSGETASLDGASPATINNRLRAALQRALAALDLFDADPQRVTEAALRLRDALLRNPDAALAPVLEQALTAPRAQPLLPRAQAALRQAQAVLWLGSDDPAQRRAAAETLAGWGDTAVRAALAARLQDEADPAVAQALRAALAAVERALLRAQVAGQLFTGLSLGSILLLAALGLAITYGLMGVINMAHGELIMVGAYATYVVQGVFRQHLPQWFDWYLLAALPVAFVTAAGVGALMERGVIRWLYGRPLETLLATWGLSLILMQAVRSVFGAQNVAVEAPQWLSGGLTVLGSLVLPWNRIAIIVFAALVLAAVALVVHRTRLGLFVRGVTQNRPIAACMGVNTARVDTYAFALGSGVAGLAGVALSQVGNVGPDLGQGYIVDSFMVVVLGGVGQLAGTVYAALGLGLVNKFIEGWAGAVLAKIAVLVLIIVVIQKRPQGLFALRGRVA